MTLRSLPLTAEQLTALAELRSKDPDVRVVLVGAAAIACHLPLQRYTQDIDIAIAIESQHLGTFLLSCGWQQDAKARQRWKTGRGVLVDTLPVGVRELAAGTACFDDGSEMNVTGFDLALQHTNLLEAESGGSPIEVEVATLPVLVVLKMVAYLDRRARTKDLADIALVFESALRDDDERRWEGEIVSLAYDEQSAWFMGQEVAKITSGTHRAVVDEFLRRLSGVDSLDFASMLRESRYAGSDREGLLSRRLRAFQTAFNAGARGAV